MRVREMMHTSTAVFLVALVLSIASSARLAAEVYDWENPSMIGRNKEPAHCTLMPFADETSAVKGERLSLIHISEPTRPY